MSTEWMLSKDPTPKLCSMHRDITYHPMRESFILVQLIVPVSGPQQVTGTANHTGWEHIPVT